LTRPPPNPLYPSKYDSDETLFLVFNTSEAILVGDNAPWSDEIEIRPSEGDELWSNNGFANIDGELFYYNSVEKKLINGEQRVFKFKECVRNLGGEETKYNHSGVKVRGFVIAEHHNQIVDAVINIQEFIGNNFSTDKTTLDWRIRNLQATPPIFDDFGCPDVNFTFNILENSQTTGVLAQYLIEINGSFTSFRLDFGDGNYTTNVLQGTHTYAPNSTPDPVLTIFNDKCSVTFTPTDRTASIEPVVVEVITPLEIPIPPPPDIPPILITPFSPLPNKYNIPPIVFPCLDVGNINSVPSNISIGISPINIPSRITISPINIPPISITPINIPSIGISPIEINISGKLGSYIELSPIQVVGGFELPSKINVYPNGLRIPETINVIGMPPNIPANIIVRGMTNIPSIIDFTTPTMVMDWGGEPNPAVDQFGNPRGGYLPPIISAIVTVQCPTGVGFLKDSSGQFIEPGMSAMGSRGYSENPSMNATIEVDSLGIPSVINIVPPNIPPLKIDASNIPSSIKIEKIDLPEQIRIIAPDVRLPSEIKIVSEADIPKSIFLDATSVPTIIQIKSDIPEFIGLNIPEDFPREIKIDASGIPSQIQVVGIPPVIEINGNIPSTIQLLMPEKPEIEMVYKGAPIDVKIQLDISKITGDDQKLNCVAIVPCK
jgi:PKD repeat protein